MLGYIALSETSGLKREVVLRKDFVSLNSSVLFASTLNKRKHYLDVNSSKKRVGEEKPTTEDFLRKFEREGNKAVSNLNYIQIRALLQSARWKKWSMYLKKYLQKIGTRTVTGQPWHPYKEDLLSCNQLALHFALSSFTPDTAIPLKHSSVWKVVAAWNYVARFFAQSSYQGPSHSLGLLFIISSILFRTGTGLCCFNSWHTLHTILPPGWHGSIAEISVPKNISLGIFYVNVYCWDRSVIALRHSAIRYFDVHQCYLEDISAAALALPLLAF